jgi:hypothetical protein
MLNWRVIVQAHHPAAVCVKQRRKGSFYTVFIKPGGKAIGSGYSAAEAWKNAIRNL